MGVADCVVGARVGADRTELAGGNDALGLVAHGYEDTVRVGAHYLTFDDVPSTEFLRKDFAFQQFGHRGFAGAIYARLLGHDISNSTYFSEWILRRVDETGYP